MDSPITPSLLELVRELRDSSDGWSGDAFCVSAEVAERAAVVISRLMAQGGLVEPLQPSASLEVTDEMVEQAALAVVRVAGYSDEEIQQIKDIPASSSAPHWWHYQRSARAAITAALQASEGRGSSNPVDDGAVERAAWKALRPRITGYGEDHGDDHHDDSCERCALIQELDAALEAAEPRP